MESPIKPIPTRYKGNVFRSRTEARWAVFFDAFGVDWIYEPEGFDLGAIWYLPDFWLQKSKTWVEIKGRSPTLSELEKAAALANASRQRVLVVSGQPWPNEHSVILISPNSANFERQLEWDEINGAPCLRNPNGLRIEIQQPYFMRNIGVEFYKDTNTVVQLLSALFKLQDRHVFPIRSVN